MVDVDAGDDGDIGVDHVDRVEAPAEADFEDRHVEPGAGQQMHDGQGGEFEIRQRDGLREASYQPFTVRTAARH